MRCIESLLNQDLPRNDYEIILVENGSANLSDFCLRHGVKYFNIPKKDLPAARNLALENSLGEFVLTIDADCVAHRSWISEALSFFETNPSVAAFGGRIRKYQPSTRSQRYGSTLVDGQVRLSYLLSIAPFPYVVTANAGFRRQVILSIGGFDPQFQSGSDVDICYRLCQVGREIRIHANAIVEHEDRSGSKLHFKRFYKYAVYQVLLFKKYRKFYQRRIYQSAYPLVCISKAIYNFRKVFWGHQSVIEIFLISYYLAIEGIAVLLGNIAGGLRFRVFYLCVPRRLRDLLF